MTDTIKDSDNRDDYSSSHALAGSRKPIGLPPQIWDALLQIRDAQESLEDKYPSRNRVGKENEVAIAAVALREAHKCLMHYANEIENSI